MSNTETVTITGADNAPNPSLEEQAKEKGIATEELDEQSFSQEAHKAEPEAEEHETNEKSSEDTPDTEENSETEDTPDEEQEEEQDGEEELTPEQIQEEIQSISDRFWENNGELSEEDRTKAAKLYNVPEELVDQFAKSQKAVVELERQNVFSAVGGQEAYTSMIEWAGNNLSESEVDSYNRAVNSGNMDDVMNAVKGLQARYESSEGVEPQRSASSNTSNASNTSQVYESVAELQADINKPEYKSNPAFRDRVMKKLANSDIM